MNKLTVDRNAMFLYLIEYQFQHINTNQEMMRNTSEICRVCNFMLDELTRKIHDKIEPNADFFSFLMHDSINMYSVFSSKTCGNISAHLNNSSMRLIDGEF